MFISFGPNIDSWRLFNGESRESRPNRRPATNLGLRGFYETSVPHSIAAWAARYCADYNYVGTFWYENVQKELIDDTSHSLVDYLPSAVSRADLSGWSRVYFPGQATSEFYTSKVVYRSAKWFTVPARCYVETVTDRVYLPLLS